MSKCQPITEGLTWATEQVMPPSNVAFEAERVWNVIVSFRGQQIIVPLQPEDPVSVCSEFIADGFGADPEFTKVLHRGRLLDLNVSVNEQGVRDGDKLLLLASSSAEVFIKSFLNHDI